ncbi:Spx/MgsR family RNA polymerase-binding regulatory protein [Lactococcus garvieae]|uniref:Spx/MgsR family RNA polymerase-binding regulatory protein n=1 Tax=Lactococcus garvieae TaxID=1363 RepID=A0AA46TVB8_9LACT|nr:Spx/MgsR family RNA polymerase-binding regulatory protein [Lactococcus garvieae]UYT10284.1 Spx/MgsR family RNA polymerase-binding regulatory protein [Lactococcus garvieae]UYT12314.1 Spx/MgsR family RNA polymerase-binding regulatory protein [Lactococcus garvieae]
MIKIYTTSSASSRKAIDWLVSHNLNFKEINWKSHSMTMEEFFKILSLTEKGISEIISKKCLAYHTFSTSLNNLTLEEVFMCVQAQKALLRVPLIFDEHHLQVGFNSDDIRQFIPREVRKVKRNY